MHKRFYVFGVLALALVAGGVSVASARADDASEGQGDMHTGVTMTVSGEGDAPANVTASGTVRVTGETENESGDRNEATSSATSSEREQEQGDQASTTGREHATENSEAPEHASEMAFEHSHAFLFEGLASTTAVTNMNALKQSIQERKQEIEDQIASSSPEERPVLENASSTAVAVHALLAARTMLGGIGQQVSQIAQGINQSLATTTNAQTQIESRGFWTKLFFGGDTQAADAITQAVQQTQQNIAQLTSLLSQSSTTATSVKATLETEIQAMQQEQTRLQDLANQQKGLWGIFSWRF